jgi:hypothetical protein
MTTLDGGGRAWARSYSEEKVMAVSKGMEQLELGHEDNSDTKDEKKLGDGGSLLEDGA